MSHYTYYKFNRETYPGVDKLNEGQFGDKDTERFAPLDPEIVAEIEAHHAAKRAPTRTMTPEESRAEAIEELGHRWTEMQEAQEKDTGNNPDTPFN